MISGAHSASGHMIIGLAKLYLTEPLYELPVVVTAWLVLVKFGRFNSFLLDHQFINLGNFF